MKFIQSKENKIFKQYKNLNKRKFRDTYNQFLIEGEKFIDDAIDKNQSIECIIVNNFYEKYFEKYKEYEIVSLEDTLFNELSDTVHSQGVIAVINKNQSMDISLEDPIVILDKLQDPGNMGTILRTSVAAGIKNIVTIKGSVDIYNPKVVRSTAGAIFNIRSIEIDDVKHFADDIKAQGYKLITTKMEAETAFNEYKYSKKTAIVIGNEGKGISKEIFELSDLSVKIPLFGEIESLNASVAAAIIIYEMGSQLNK